MPGWISTLIGAFGGSTLIGIFAVLKFARDRKNQQGAKQTAIEEGMLALLHDRIFGIYAECSHKGFAGVEDLRNLAYLYQPYHAMGGNGTGTELYNRVKDMPDRQAEQEVTA